MNKLETNKILTTIAAVYQNFEINEFKQGIWHELLKDIEFRHAGTALMETLRSSKFPPTPADIIEKARVEMFIAKKQEEERAIEGIRNKSISGKS